MRDVDVKCLVCGSTAWRRVGDNATLLRFSCDRCLMTRVDGEFEVRDRWTQQLLPSATQVINGAKLPLSQHRTAKSFTPVSLSRSLKAWMDAVEAGGRSAAEMLEEFAAVQSAAMAARRERDAAAVENYIRETRAKIYEAMRMLPGAALPVIDGSVIGYRAWRLDTSSWCLTGTGYHGEWRTGVRVHEAECKQGRGFADRRHVAPDPECECGIYALARFSDRSSWWNGHQQDIVIGAIEAWADPDENLDDRFFLHPGGFRAQYAKIVLLAVKDDWPRAHQAAVKALAHEYGADVCKFDHLEMAATEHGQLVPDELMAWAEDESQVWDGHGVEPSETMVALAEKSRETAAALDEFVEAWHRGEMSAPEARRRMGLQD